MRRLAARFRVASDAGPAVRTQLDDALGAALDELLDIAIERAGVARSDEICLRRVHIAARLRLDHDASQLAVQWSVAAADAIVSEISKGGPNVVRYRSRPDALLDLLRATARGDLSRAWAWRQLGLWPEGIGAGRGALANAVLGALAVEPHAAPALLDRAAREDALSLIAGDGAAAAWRALERAVLEAAGLGTGDMGAAGSHDGRTRVSGGAFSGASADAAAHDGERAAGAGGDNPPAEALATLASRGALWRACADDMRRWTDARRAFATLALLAAAPELAGGSSRPFATARSALLGRSARQSVHTATSNAATPTGDPDTTSRMTRPGCPPAEPEAVEAFELPDTRPTMVTRSGGLLLLLNLVGALDIPSRVAGDPRLRDRLLAWTLHQFAMTLASIDAADPAALAFCGHAHGSPPSAGGLPPSDIERAAIASYRDEIVDELDRRLGGRAVDHDTLIDVIRRRAELRCDPAWIEVRYAMDDVSVPIRRAGLDLDPGWLPWLGAVVRFVYV